MKMSMEMKNSGHQGVCNSSGIKSQELFIESKKEIYAQFTIQVQEVVGIWKRNRGVNGRSTRGSSSRKTLHTPPGQMRGFFHHGNGR
jgi:hypothetical protein